MSYPYTERIICPECSGVSLAGITWEEGNPWPSYVHECPRCHYQILESEWDAVPRTTKEVR